MRIRLAKVLEIDRIYDLLSISMETVAIEKKPAPKDWHPADVICALKKSGWSLRRLSLKNGYAPTSLRAALSKPWPRAERIIVEAIGTHLRPEQIWPTRYDARGRPSRPMGRPRKPINNDTTRRARRNVHARGAQ